MSVKPCWVGPAIAAGSAPQEPPRQAPRWCAGFRPWSSPRPRRTGTHGHCRAAPTALPRCSPTGPVRPGRRPAGLCRLLSPSGRDRRYRVQLAGALGVLRRPHRHEAHHPADLLSDQDGISVSVAAQAALPARRSLLQPIQVLVGHLPAIGGLQQADVEPVKRRRILDRRVADRDHAGRVRRSGEAPRRNDRGADGCLRPVQLHVRVT